MLLFYEENTSPVESGSWDPIQVIKKFALMSHHVEIVIETDAKKMNKIFFL